MPPFGGIEAGGTKFVCAVGTGPDDLSELYAIPTTTARETLRAAIAYFEQCGPLEAIGIACFGPVELDPASPRYGWITTTPKGGD